MIIARQRFGKRVPEITQSAVEGPPLLGIKSLGAFRSNGKPDNNREELFESVIYLRFAPRCKRESVDEISVLPRVEAGSNTSTVTLRVVGGDEKGSLKSKTLKYARESQGTRTKVRLR
jgi:hypothetical protein